MPFKVGDTFLLPKPRQVEHLWIVLEGEDEEGQILCVNITTKREDSDSTVILQPGEHGFVKHESVVHFEDARWMPMEHVCALVDRASPNLVCERSYACTHAVMDKVKKGLLDSKRTPIGIKAFCKSKWR